MRRFPFMNEHNVLMLAGIGVIVMFCQWIAWRVRVPAILFLLLAGIVAGPLGGWLNPDPLFGRLLFPFISLSVAIILFEGSLTLQFHEIRGLETVVRRLISGGLVITWLITTLATRWIMGFSWELAFLFGAITVVTGPTVIAPLLLTVRPVARVANVLRWEGIAIDPIGALLAVLVYEFIVSLGGGAAWGNVLLTFGEMIAIGGFVGVGSGMAAAVVLRRNWLPDHLMNIAMLVLVFAVFAGSDALHPESGLLSVTLMGIFLANRKGVPVEEILAFKETLSLMLLSVLFVILAARMDLESLLGLGWKALLVLAVMVFVARPLKMLFATWGSPLPWKERALLAWMAPRGIVAAAVSALFAIQLEAQGVTDAKQLLPLTFMVIIGTVVLQSLTARPLAVALGVALPEPNGFLIVGANSVARAIGKALQGQDVPVLLCDSNWDNIATARMDGLPTYYGSAISEHADRHLDLAGLGRMLALAPDENYNALVAAHYRDQFGRKKVYILQSSTRQDSAGKHRSAAVHSGDDLFGAGITFGRLASLIGQGAAVRATTLSDAFDFVHYQNSGDKPPIPLFLVDTNGYVLPVMDDGEMAPPSGWTVLGLVPPEGGSA